MQMLLPTQPVVGTRRRFYVATTSMQRRDVNVTTLKRIFLEHTVLQIQT